MLQNASLIHCFLQPQVTAQDFDRDLPQISSLSMGGICVPPFWVKKATRELHNSSTSVICAVGYPFGYQMTETKVQEIELALDMGAQGFLVALNLSAFRSGMNWPKIELAKCAQLIHHSSQSMYLLLPASLKGSELEQLAKTGRDAGVDGLVFEIAQNRMANLEQLRKWTPDTIELSIMAMGLKHEDYQHILTMDIDRLWSPNLLEILHTNPST